jgi:hypothetical protein
LNALRAVLDNAMGNGRGAGARSGTGGRGAGGAGGGGGGGDMAPRKGAEGTHEDGTKPAALFAAMVVYSAAVVLM